MFAAFEVLLGVWVMVGLQPRWTRLVLLTCFRAFLHKTDEDAGEGFNASKKTQIQVLAVGELVGDEEFDPVFPPKTILGGDLAKRRGSTGDTPVRASAVTREEPLQVPPRKPQPATPTGRWLPIALDLAVIGLAVVFRRRFAF